MDLASPNMTIRMHNNNYVEMFDMDRRVHIILTIDEALQLSSALKQVAKFMIEAKHN